MMNVLLIQYFVLLFVWWMQLNRSCLKYEHSGLVCKTANSARLFYAVLHYISLLVVADLCLVFGESKSYVPPTNIYLKQGGKVFFLIPAVFLSHRESVCRGILMISHGYWCDVIMSEWVFASAKVSWYQIMYRRHSSDWCSQCSHDLCVVQKFWPHASVMLGAVMFGPTICPILNSWHPVESELPLCVSAPEPVDSHVLELCWTWK